MQQGPNRRLGKFELVERLGGGGMAEVYRARLHGPGGFVKEVALKLILPQFSDEPEFVDMFIREATVAASLDHASIVRIHEFDQIDGTYYIAMELVDGRDLRALIAQAKRLGRKIRVEEALAIGLEIARGLAFAHGDYSTGREPVVHRDISPHNIILSRAGEVKITDFGIAKMASAASLTKTGVVKGKAAYMSPEQARGEPVDGRSDIFSLGCVLWELLTCQRLFSGENDFAILERLQHGEIFPCSNYNSAVGKDVDELVLKALQREPAKRFQTASEMASRLDRALGGLCEDRTTLLVDLYKRMFGSERPKTAIMPAAEADSSNSGQVVSKSPAREEVRNTGEVAAEDQASGVDGSVAEPAAGAMSVNPDSESTASGPLPATSGVPQDEHNRPTVLLPVNRQQEPTVLLAGDGAAGKGSGAGTGKNRILKVLAPLVVAVAVAGGYLLLWNRSPAKPDKTEHDRPEATGEVGSAEKNRHVERLLLSSQPAGLSRENRPQASTAAARVEGEGKTSAGDATEQGKSSGKVAATSPPARQAPSAGKPEQLKKPAAKTAKKQPPRRKYIANKKDRPSRRKNKKIGAARVRKGKVDINVIPWARVYWKGKSLGDTPLRGVVLPAGVQKLLLVNNKLGVKKYVKMKVIPNRRVVKVFDITK
ncbi:MAG: serine/threonine protein kinase [Deltaproteobacteria bacterium]|nr:MAG: serine/threonine protein kinase [Deltaproteobacteria bacterium]